MNFFNNPDLDERVKRIKFKIDIILSPDNIGNVSENGIPIAKKLLEDTFEDMNYIKKQVGVSDENYIEVSEAIALGASGCIKFPVSYISALVHADGFKQDKQLLAQTKNKLIEATRLMAIITDLPMRYEAQGMVNRVNVMITDAERQIQSGSGCFIATFAFNDYNSPEVLFLRYYRDNALSQNQIGRFVIKFYYLISPYVVLMMKRIPNAKKVSRLIITQIINLLKK